MLLCRLTRPQLPAFEDLEMSSADIRREEDQHFLLMECLTLLLSDNGYAITLQHSAMRLVNALSALLFSQNSTLAVN